MMMSLKVHFLLAKIFILLGVVLGGVENAAWNKKITNVKYVNVTVAHNGLVKTIGEAIKMAPDHNPSPYVIFIKAGKYVEENLTVADTKTNIWLIGEGRGRTKIVGDKSAGKNYNTMESATLVIWGAGHLVQDMTIVNEAGPENFQAVALLVGANQTTIYRCEIKGYQDTLYVHRGHQFYRACDIYGTVDYIFGVGTAVFQNCTLWARKPLAQQTNAITAQGRDNKNAPPSGISIHGCYILATPELKLVKPNIPTFLGRPWRMYATVVYLQSYLGDHIDPKGWLEWNSPVDNLYYGEFNNNGPGANVSQRVKWPGLHLKMNIQQAQKFTVAQFIQGQTWIYKTGVPYQEGLY